MHISKKWKSAIGVAAAVLVAGGVVGITGVAGADPTTKSTEFVDGYGDFTDDWNDNEREAGVLCDDCDNAQGTDLVIMWQAVLASDGFLGLEDVDGYFGSATAEATAEWQDLNGLDSTGEVGQATWATADDNLFLEDDQVNYSTSAGGSFSMCRYPEDGSYELCGEIWAAGEGEKSIINGNLGDSRVWLFKMSISPDIINE